MNDHGITNIQVRGTTEGSIGSGMDGMKQLQDQMQQMTNASNSNLLKEGQSVEQLNYYLNDNGHNEN